MADKPPAIIVIKRPKAGGGGHHGGAWKIAYADFVTAMMAFFLLLWLMASTSKEQRQGISDFFNAIPSLGGTGADGIMQGRVADVDGNNASRTPSSNDPSVILPTHGSANRRSDEAEPMTAAAEVSAAAVQEQEQFDDIESSLRRAMRSMPEIAGNLVVERTADGLRIQLVDQERAPMFASGSAALSPRLEQLLKLVAPLVLQVTNAIAVGGHTDAHPLARGDYSNWELSADRANAARRTLVAMAVPDHRFSRVMGLSDRQPLIADNPTAAANRRISVLLMSNLAPKGAP